MRAIALVVGVVGLVMTLSLSIDATDPDDRAYTLISYQASPTVILVDSDGNEVNTWNCDYKGISGYLMPDGGIVRRYSWDGELLWNFTFNNESLSLHIVSYPLPNGNYLLSCIGYRTYEEVIQAGRNPGGLRGDYLNSQLIVEVRPTGFDTGEIVWKWDIWDHLIQDFDSSKDNYGVIADNPD